MTDGHCFISYSTADALEFASRLASELGDGKPSIPVWFDKNNLKPGNDWDVQIDEGLKTCRMVLFVITKDSVNEKSVCKQEWSRALSYKKPIIPIWLHNDALVPFRIQDRQRIDFRKSFETGLKTLQEFIIWLDSPEGVLRAYKDRLADAERDIQRAGDEDQPRIQADIDELQKQIELQERIVADPEAAKKQTEQNIQNGLERERKPQLPVASFQSSKFINQPPGVAQNYFQDRLMETEQAILFLKNEAQRVLTVVGRGGAGKTAMTCRLLKYIENGGLPDDYDKKHDKVDIDGIVYLSEAGSRKVNFANLFEDLCKLLPAASAEKLSALYREPQTSTESKTVQLLAAFQGLKQVIVLLDNFENVVDAEKGQVRDAELDEALRAILHAPHHPVKIIITTRVSARELDTFEPARQRLLPLDTGLQPEYAREAFVLMDEGNLVGIKNAGADLLNLAVTRTLGLPRALEALYAALRTDRFTTLQELIDLPILPEQVVQAYVGEAFNRLDTNAQKVMQALAVYNRPVTPAAVDYLLAPHLPAIDSAPILQRLANMHFARKESGRFYLHPVDREFAFGLIGNQVIRNQELGIRKQDSNSSQSLIPNQLFTQHDLTVRAADFFAAARKPRAEWKKLEDLSAQLAEFDLRCAAGDYDTAVTILLGIDKALELWGHYNPQIRAYERISEKVTDKNLNGALTNNLGWFFYCVGELTKSIEQHHKALQISKEVKNIQAESAALNNLSSAYLSFGEIQKAISFLNQSLSLSRDRGDYLGETITLNWLGNCYLRLGKLDVALSRHNQALKIAQEIDNQEGIMWPLGNIGISYYYSGQIDKSLTHLQQALKICRSTNNRRGEAQMLSRIGNAFLDIEEYQQSIVFHQQSIKISDEISFSQAQNSARLGLAQNFLLQNDLVNARATIEAALQYDVPENNHNASALHGIIALRQGDEVTARGAFVRAIGQADEILSKTAEYYSALDAKGLAICGLAIVGATRRVARTDDDRGAASYSKGIPAPEGDGANTGRGDPGQGNPAPTVDDAIETFRKARKIAPHAGVVKSVLRLFDELVKCDGEGILSGVREVIGATPLDK